MSLNLFTRWDASLHLSQWLGNTPNHWYGFLNKNSRTTEGYKITWHIFNGELHYTEKALNEFVRVNLSSNLEKSKKTEERFV